MNKKEEKILCQMVLAEVSDKIPNDFANKVLAKYPDTPLHTLVNVRYGRTFKRDMLNRLLSACQVPAPRLYARQLKTA